MSIVKRVSLSLPLRKAGLDSVDSLPIDVMIVFTVLDPFVNAIYDKCLDIIEVRVDGQVHYD